MKLKALMLSAAVLLGSAAVAFAQTNTEPPKTPAGPTSAQTGTTSQPQKKPHLAAQPNAGAEPMSKHAAIASRRGEISPASAARATTALNVLEDHGYRDFSSFRPTGRDFEITANQNGKTVMVVVDPDSKAVRTQG